MLRVEARLWGDVLQYKVGDLDMFEPAELLFSRGMHPQYVMHVRFVASDVPEPSRVEDVLGVATVELPMADNHRLATVSVAVRKDRQGEGLGAALHSAAIEAAIQHGRTTVQSWTWESLHVPAGARELAPETGTGAIDGDSRGSRFLVSRGYVLGQIERLSRLHLPSHDILLGRREDALGRVPEGYEFWTVLGRLPDRLLQGAAALSISMAADSPSGAMDVEDEYWDAARVRSSEEALEAAQRDQLQTLVRYVPTGEVVGFTRLFRDRGRPAVAHQWETLVLSDHRGKGLGLMLKNVNHGGVAEFWPGVSRIITGNASENRHMLAINEAMAFEPFAASGFWELRDRGALQ